MTTSHSILKPALIIMAGRMFGYVACFAIPIVLVRIFDQATFGTYKQLFLIFGTLYGIAQLGMAESLYYFVPERTRRAGRYVFNALIGLAVSGALVATGLWLFEEQVAAALNNEMLVGLLPLVGIYVALMMMASVMETVMTARNRHRLASGTYATSDLVRAAVSILPVLVVPQLRWLMVWAVAFAAARFAASIFYLVREFGAGFKPGGVLVGRQFAYAAPFSVAILIELLQANLHLYFVSYHFEPAVFAVYAVACLQIPVVDFLSQSANNVLMVRMRELMSVGTDAVLQVWNDAIEKLSLLLFPLVGVLLVTAHEFIAVLFTRDYIEAAPIFMAWTLSFLLAALPADAALRVYAQTRYLIAINAVRLVLVVALITLFMRWFGLLGPVLVTLAGMVVFKWMALARIASLLKLPAAAMVPWRRVGRIALLAAVAAVPALAVKNSFAFPAFVDLVLAGLVYGGTYSVLVFTHGQLAVADKLALTGIVQRPFGALARAWRG
ncbi:MAG: lipopolysaccharide biosynthesis protein [Xanthomonadaceae bacterium]|nr:lipopolysaccharide biosynthesis protein [Xanthomonadaceae bacterium]